MLRPPIGLTRPCVIEKIVDGDTVDVEVRYTLRVRLDECWAPESRTRDPHEKERGLAAKASLAELLPVGSEALVHIAGSEQSKLADVLTLDRVLGRVWPAGSDHDASTHQVAHGHATPTKEKPAA